LPHLFSTHLTHFKNLASWTEKINKPLFSKLVDSRQDMKADVIDVVGQKAIIEASGKATQNNGKPYNNK
jgi:hypothetical protein